MPYGRITAVNERALRADNDPLMTICAPLLYLTPSSRHERLSIAERISQVARLQAGAELFDHTPR